jgi:uracil-DNA glycosylase family 4
VARRQAWKPQQVPGEGPLRARVVLIGEAPGVNEDRVGRPFVGASGYRLGEWLAAVGLPRHQVRIENVCEFKPPGDVLAAYGRDCVLAWMEDLRRRITLLEDPYVLVPMGNYALYALTGFGNVPWHAKDGPNKRPGIMKWRGSILQHTDARGRVIKVIPTLHPAATFPGRSPGPEGETWCRRDFRRIAEEAQFRELRRPEREHFIKPSMRDLLEWERQVERETEHTILFLDIENPRRTLREVVGQTKTGKPKYKKTKGDPYIECLGMSLYPDFSITVPTTEEYWGDLAVLDEVWGVLRRLMAHRIQKGAQNHFHDSYYLLDYACPVAQMFWDPMYMHHSYDASAPHDIAFQSSILTREPYWKDEAKDPEQADQYTSNLAAFYTYNGKDAAVGRELVDCHLAVMSPERQDFYWKHYATLFEPLMDLMRRGVRVDLEARRMQAQALTQESAEVREKLLEATGGVDLFGEKAISGTKLKNWMYRTLEIPPVTKKRKAKGGERTEAADEVTLKKLMRRYPEKLQAPGALVLQHRRVSKLKEFYAESRLGPDKRFYSAYGLNTEAGRLQSKKNPRGWGSNAQNIDREARAQFLAEEGCVAWEVDGSQVELRLDLLYAYLVTNNERLLERAWAKPGDLDQHSETAAQVFGLELAALQASLKLPKDSPERKHAEMQRYLGKKTNHAAWREMGGEKFADELLKEAGMVVTREEAQAWLDLYKRAFPEMSEFFRWVRLEILRDRKCTNSWGRVLPFEYDRLDDEAYRRGYSFHPQSDCADWMNQKGFVPLWYWLQAQNRRADFFGCIHVQGHDSLFGSVRRENAWELVEFLVGGLEAECTYRLGDLSTPLVIPATVKVGLSWDAKHEFKALPSRAQFEEVVYGL